MTEQTEIQGSNYDIIRARLVEQGGAAKNAIEGLNSKRMDLVKDVLPPRHELLQSFARSNIPMMFVSLDMPPVRSDERNHMIRIAHDFWEYVFA